MSEQDPGVTPENNADAEISALAFELAAMDGMSEPEAQHIEEARRAYTDRMNLAQKLIKYDSHKASEAEDTPEDSLTS